ncbi:MAG: CDP-glycerol glycerophosphotransferase family protein [Fluviicola sp.]
MKLLITDNNKVYLETSVEKKLLLGNGLISKCSFLSENQLTLFNSHLNGIEARAAELMIEELKKTLDLCPDFIVNPFLKTRNKKDIAYSLLYSNFKKFVLLKHQLILTLNAFFSQFLSVEISSIEIELSEKYSLFEIGDLKNVTVSKLKFYNDLNSIKLKWYKNLYYLFFNLFLSKRISSKTNKKQLLLVLFDTFNDLDLFKKFFKIVENSTDVHLNIVQIKSGISKEQSHSIDHLKSENISCYQIEEFRSFVKHTNSDFYSKIKNINPKYAVFEKNGLNENLEIYYSYFNTIFKKLKPDVCVNDNTGEIGRALADVSRFYQKPSVNVEYGLFSDDAIHMESNIQYSVRACLGQSGIDVWKKRNDPSLQHTAIGFLKLEDLDLSLFNKQAFFEKNNLLVTSKTLFFASTWGGTNELYNEEKKAIVLQIAETAKEKNWNFIIKKHPAETDRFLEECLASFPYEHIKVFQHPEINLYEALTYSDYITTQFSSISVEALYCKKPTIFFNLSTENSFVDQLTMKDEFFIFSVKNKQEFEEKLNFIEENSLQISSEIEKATEKYLFKTDSNSSERLLDLLKNI